jgi:hypothetical protein
MERRILYVPRLGNTESVQEFYLGDEIDDGRKELAEVTSHKILILKSRLN